MTFSIRNGKLEKYEGNDSAVVVPEGVTEIADYAFHHAVSIENVILPDGLKEIGSYVFYDCERLHTIHVPDSVIYMGQGVFSRCKSLVHVTLPVSLTSIPKITFHQCESLRYIILPSAAKKISRACFQQCHALTEVVLPSQLEILEENVFDDCVSLKVIELPDKLHTIMDNAFFQCEQLRELVLPASLVHIGKGAFETRGVLSIKAPDDLKIHPSMLDNNWNMNWNFGANGRYNGKNEDNYQLVDSYLPCVDLRQWKPVARVILCVNYLSSWKRSLSEYDTYIAENTDAVLAQIVQQKRYRALRCGIEHELFSKQQVEPYMKSIKDPVETAWLMDRFKKTDDPLDHLLEML